ncbi:MAG: T9SS type A sorting domain-containing protein, partial [Flavipsychrobacter sp.]
KGNDYTLPYKNDVNFMNHNVFNDNPSTEVSANQKSIALPASDPNTIYYAGTDNNLYQAVQTATDVWSTTEITNPYMASGQYIGGDLTYDDVSGHLFYRGTDNRLSMWGYNSAINYWWVVYVDADFAHTDKLVSTTPGSIALQDGKVFYIGQDKKIHTFIWDPSCSCMVHTLVPYSYGSNELAAGDIFVEGFSGIPDYHVIYKGVDNRLQILGPLTGSSNWHGWLDPTAALPAVSSKPGSVTRNTNHESYYFIGSDDKIHGLIWNGTAFVPDTHIETYSYGSPSLGYPNADYARGNITYEQATDRILYFGYDGRLQYFQLIPSTGDWYHGWIDDYWNTNQYGTWNSSDPAANMPSLIVQPSSGAYFYTGNVSYTNYLLPGNPTINENQNLRYFIWQPCENLNPVSGSNQNLNKLTPQVTAPANTTVHEYKIFPNPVQDNLNIQVVGNHVGSQKFIIQNVEGKQIMESVFDGTATTVDVSAFTPGIYFLNINDGNRQYHYKFIKNK